MCLIVFAWQPGHSQPLILAANRDEFFPRPCLAAAPWPDAPGIIAGRDLQAGGTWLGLGPEGRFAALTNIRDLSLPQGERSRGDLPVEFLRGSHTPEQYLHEVAEQHQLYGGFNLLVGDQNELWHFNSKSAVINRLKAGVYGVSNADLNTPWPKLERAKRALKNALPTSDPIALFNLLNDSQRAADEELPQTGISLEMERMLSSVFIASTGYGTRASTVLTAHADGSRIMHERSYGPDGVFLGEVRIEYPLQG
ncbi:NRDE family protein [Ectopseudomonas mendocina]|uniref:NRDE family protein n=1 Tax=Ectopseudomonas mendocina TaxID=300 RepID=A0ABZ2REI0_ECTME